MTPWKRTAESALLASLYFIGGKLSSMSAYTDTTVIWPPSGFALAAFIFLGRRAGPAIFIGAFAAALSTKGSVAASLAIAVGGALEGLAGAYLVHRFAGGRAMLDRPRNFFNFVLLAAALSTMIGATAGATGLSLGGASPWNQFGSLWLDWWRKDMIGDIVITPLLVAWATPRLIPWNERRTLEFLILMISLFIVGEIVFGALLAPAFWNYHRTFLCAPILAWPAFRFGRRETSAAIFMLSCMAVAGATHGFGSVARTPSGESLFVLQAFIGVTAVMTMAMASDVLARKHAQLELRSAQEELKEQLARHTGALTKANEEIQFLHAMTKDIAEAESLHQALQVVLSKVSQVSNWTVGQAWIPNADGTALECSPAAYIRAPNLEFFRRISQTRLFIRGAGLPGKTWETRDTTWMRDVPDEPTFPLWLMAQAAGLKTGVGIPVMAQGKIVAVLEFFSLEAREEDKRAVALLSAVAGQIGSALARKAAEEALKESEMKFRALAQTARDAIIVSDVDGNIVSWNDGAGRIFGYAAEEVWGKSLTLLMPERYRHAHLADIARMKTTGESRLIGKTMEFHGLRKDKTEFPMEISMSGWNSGKAAFHTAIIRDITQRKEAEEALERKSEELARSNTELALFASIASHELQEPLRKVIAFGGLFKKSQGETLGDQGAQYLGSIINATERMNRLIDALLEFSRVTTKARSMESVDLGRLVREVVAEMDDRISQHQGRVEVKRLPTLRADPLQMRQLFQNLLSNALKFSRKGVVPHVEIDSRSPINGFAEITVKDNGIGFEEQYADRIFKPFQRLHTRGEYEGTGMGLAICQRILLRHGGQVSARSEPGKGSTFVILLPV